MIYAKVSNNEIVEYPADPRSEHKDVEIPAFWQGGTIGKDTYVPVKYTSAPQVNVGWVAVETTPILSSGNWEKGWTSNLLPKPELKNTISDYRCNIEVGGVVIANNKYSTDRESQIKYVAVAVDISQSNASTWSINWKTSDDKFIKLNAQDMLDVISGVRKHVQSCYDKESEYFTLINISNTSVLEATDFSAGWPSNS